MGLSATELRIGNWVKGDTGKPFQIELSDFLDWWNDHNSHEYGDHIHPIPLTEEWLLKLGFEKSDLIGFDGGWQRSTDSKYYIQQMSNAITIHLITEESVALLTGFHFVHQLQNLYFALTGEELNLKQSY